MLRHNNHNGHDGTERIGDEIPLMNRELSENDFVTSDIDVDDSASNYTFGDSSLTGGTESKIYGQRQTSNQYSGSISLQQNSGGDENSRSVKHQQQLANNNHNHNLYPRPPPQYGEYEAMKYQCHPYYPQHINRPNYSLIIICVICCATLLQISQPYGVMNAKTGGMYNNANLRPGMNNMQNMNMNGGVGYNNMQGANGGPAQGFMNNGGAMNGGLGLNNYYNNMQGLGGEEMVETPVDADNENNVEAIEGIAEDEKEELKENADIAPQSDGEEALYELQELENFKDNWDEWDPTDVPIFFHIPKAGGSSIKDIMGTCHRFVMATETGITDGFGEDTEIAIVYPGGGPQGSDRSPFVNVDTTTVDGIARAKEMGFADSGLADAVVTPFIYEANDLFTPTAKGRLFTVFRHPIDRAISMFYYLQVADWEPTFDPELADWTIEQYATSDRIENNWLTRQLSNQPGGELTPDDVSLAMEVIRRKVMVGLMTDIERTTERFERFFRWTYHVNPTNQEQCREELLTGGSNSNAKNKKEKPEPGSKEWELLEWQNKYDLELYEYIEALFEEQEAFVADIPADFRNIDATCCKCDPPTEPPEGFTCPMAILF